ncbi:DUF4254 domain-containing protein [Mycobacterium sp. ML4]
MTNVDANSLGRTTLADTGLLSGVGQFYASALAWHDDERTAVSGSGGIAAQALQLHALNFDLWHHEDAVRRVGAGDREIARRKRCIDDLNARRCGAIEDIDVTLLERLSPNPSAPLHTDTPGTIVDRLSVLALRICHAKRAEHHRARLELLQEQYDDLTGGLEKFMASLQRGTIRFKVYRQFKSAGQQNYCALFEIRDS